MFLRKPTDTGLNVKVKAHRPPLTVIIVKSEISFDLIPDYKPAPLPLPLIIAT